MSVRTKLRAAFDAGTVRRLAKASKDAAQTRRLMALAAIDEGGSHLDAARIGGVIPQIVRDWVVRFNARGHEDLISGHAGSSACKLADDHPRALAKMVDDGLDPAVDGVVRWRLKDLVSWLDKEHGVSLDETTIGRALKALGYAKLSARPRHHAQDEHAIADFKKGPGRRGGRQNQASCRDTDRGVMAGRSAHRPEERHHPTLGQPRHPAFCASRPANRLGLSVWRHLSENRQGRRSRVAALHHGRHECPSDRNQSDRCPRRSRHPHPRQGRLAHDNKLKLPANITLLPLPPRCPELNPTENIWQSMCDNGLSNLVFDSDDQILDACCKARNKLVATPDTITSIRLRAWAHPS